jgi:L-seryl-tRNA(Ser) seleniumtransferase
VNNDDLKNRRRLPSVDRVLGSPDIASLCSLHGRSVVTGWVRQALQAMRNGCASQLSADSAQNIAAVVDRVQTTASDEASQRLRQVINGTGVLIHTNLGRAPLARAAIDAIVQTAAGTNVEIDLATGNRGQRGAAVEALCRDITGADAALIVNNCAAATLLALQTLASGRQVVISRGQLIEIGGSFRLPDVFRQSGAVLTEVGTTNRTRLSDYANASGPETAALMRVHPSNYRIVGFSESVAIADLAVLAHERGLIAIDDVGSGCLYDLAPYGLSEEPVIGESLRSGADLVLFSGDKLLGGPQCGIIVGRADLIAKLRSNPLSRALRVDKLTLAALQATLEIHRSGRAFVEIPVLHQLCLPADQIQQRGERLLEKLNAACPAVSDCFSLEQVESTTGGGALAAQSISSWAIAVSSEHPEQMSERLRRGSPAIVTRLQEGRNLIDLRTVFEQDEEALVRNLLESVAIVGRKAE